MGKIDVSVEGGLCMLEMRLGGSMLALHAPGPAFSLLNHKIFKRLCI